MAFNSAIEWTDATWNPIRARNLKTGGIGHFCEKVSPGCSRCYAERMQPRFKNVIRYNEADRKLVEVFLDEKVLTQPMRWKRGRKIFVGSMTDLFGDWVTDEMLSEVFAAMAITPHHTYQVLTKRAERMLEYIKTCWFNELAWPLPNVWLGVSVEDQKTADERIPLLLKTPAAVRFLSVEPLLEEIIFDAFTLFDDEKGIRLIDWVIAGGESGPDARPMHPDWVRSIRDQCQSAGVPFFFKQWGEWAPTSLTRDFTNKFKLFEDGSLMYKIGKKKAGRLLDGREWNEFPEENNAR